MEAFNAACDEIVATCFKKKSASKFVIQQLVYHAIREKYGLSAQLTIRAIAKTCEAYKLNKAVQPKFKKHGSITYDARILTFKGLHLPHPQVSITTLEGRQLFNLVIAAYFAGRTNRVQGQVDLVYRKGKFFLYATCDMPEETPLEPAWDRTRTAATGVTCGGDKPQPVRGDRSVLRPVEACPVVQPPIE